MTLPSPLSTTLLVPGLLVLLLACGGGVKEEEQPNGPAPAKSLAYVDPVSGDYRLVRNATLSTSTHLVLDLKGFGTARGAGLAFTFTADASRAKWTKVSPADPEPVQNGAVFSLGTAPVGLKGAIEAGKLTGGLGQKGIGSPVGLNGVLAKVALDLAPGAPAGPATLTASPDAQVLLDSGSISPVSVSVGTLSVQ